MNSLLDTTESRRVSPSISAPLPLGCEREDFIQRIDALKNAFSGDNSWYESPRGQFVSDILSRKFAFDQHHQEGRGPQQREVIMTPATPQERQQGEAGELPSPIPKIPVFAGNVSKMNSEPRESSLSHNYEIPILETPQGRVKLIFDHKQDRKVLHEMRRDISRSGAPPPPLYAAIIRSRIGGSASTSKSKTVFREHKFVSNAFEKAQRKNTTTPTEKVRWKV